MNALRMSLVSIVPVAALGGAWFLWKAVAEQGEPLALTYDERYAIKNEVDQKLSNPTSARYMFKRASIISADGNKIVCGTVEEKDKYGEYSGQRAFQAKVAQDGSVNIDLDDQLLKTVINFNLKLCYQHVDIANKYPWQKG